MGASSRYTMIVGNLNNYSETSKVNPTGIRWKEYTKDGGKKRQVDLPVVVDHFIQQSIIQVFTLLCERYFCDNSFGFRLGRNVHQALRRTQSYISDSYKFSVDLDLE